MESIFAHLGNNKENIIRFRLGIGQPNQGIDVLNYLNSPFAQENREMDLFAYSMAIAAESLQGKGIKCLLNSPCNEL